jgi:hypothetical protein
VPPPEDTRDSLTPSFAGLGRVSRGGFPVVTKTFLDGLPWYHPGPWDDQPPGYVSEVGLLLQLLVLRPLRGERAAETLLGIAPSRDDRAGERYLFAGDRLLEATKARIQAAAEDADMLPVDLFSSGAARSARTVISDFVSSESHARLTPTDGPDFRAPCIVPTGVALIGAVRLRWPTIMSLATLLASLDLAAMRGMDLAGQPASACQLDVLAIIGGRLEGLPTPAALVNDGESWLETLDTARDNSGAWSRAAHRLHGGAARRAAGFIARCSPMSTSRRHG